MELIDTIKHYAARLAELTAQHAQIDARAEVLAGHAKAALLEVEKIATAGISAAERIWPNPGVAARKK